VMDHGKGTEVWDVDGNRFLDFAAGIAVASTGHSHPDVVKAIQKQAEKFIHISSDYYHEKWIELSEKLAEIAPFSEDARVFLTNSGTESVEGAIKLARYHTKRSSFIGFLGGFHGRTIGAVTFTASKPNYKRRFLPLMNGVTHVPFPDPYRPILHFEPDQDYGEKIVEYIEEQVFEKILPADEVAGILVEPIQGEGGYIVPPAGFFPALRQLCDKYGILLMADEVQAGMGRTGKWWSIQNFGVEPDIITSAKGLASGMPLGALITRKSVMSWPKGSHGNTYGGNPIACVASLATINAIENGYMENTKVTGSYTLKKLKEFQDHHPSIGDVRGMGFMIGIDFVKDRLSKKEDPEIRDRVVDLAYEYGLLTLGCGKSVIRISPPLCTTKEQIDEGLQILDHVISLAENK
ncbi:MAG TPA: acetyl ornithine aminotransferase family protein, partial [Anaerolineaceae bacterium]|nr:acetyl ornithine aminotransferase family protein [Anaerolineaceae bacterium]